MRIKLFHSNTPDYSEVEKKVNDFLEENAGMIEVKDIKYTAVSPNPNNTKWVNWTVMIVYNHL